MSTAKTLKKSLMIPIVLCIIGGLSMGYFWANIATQDNPATYCNIIANTSSVPKNEPNSKTYVKSGRAFEIYDPKLHVNVDKYYIVYGDSDINDANWESSGAPCRLVLMPFLGVFAIFFCVGVVLFGAILSFISKMFKR